MDKKQIYSEIDNLYRSSDSYNDAVLQLIVLSDKGEPEAMARLARAYRDGRGVERDLQKALGLLNGAEKSGVSWASRDKLDVLWAINTPDSLAEFVRLAEKLVEGGDPEAYVRLSRAYRDGKSVQKDLAFSEELLKEAEKRGSKYAKYDLLDLYKCVGTAQYNKKYYEESKRLHESNDYNGTLRLARAYRDACGVKKNIPLAIELYKQAISHDIDVSNELNSEVLTFSNFEQIPDDFCAIYAGVIKDLKINGLIATFKNIYEYWVKLLNKKIALPKYEQSLSVFLEKLSQKPISTEEKIKSIARWNRNARILYHFVENEIELSKPIFFNDLPLLDITSITRQSYPNFSLNL